MLQANDPMAAVAPLRSAVELDQAMTPYHLVLGIALANTGDLGAARTELSTAALGDDLPEAWLDLAAVEARLGNRDAALASLDRALRLGDQQAGVALAAGAVYVELDRDEDATRTFAKAMLLAPTLAGDPWWTQDERRTALRSSAYSMALEAAPPSTRFVLGLEDGSTSTVLAAIDGLDPDSATTSRLVQLAWQGDANALARLKQRARDRPFDTAVVNWCALLLRRAGDIDAAERYARWANTVSGDASLGGYELRVATAPTPRVAGLSTLYYGQYTYRRPVPSHQLVMWLPELGYR